MGNTVKLHRVFTAKPEKVYRAFIEGGCLGPLAAAGGVYLHGA